MKRILGNRLALLIVTISVISLSGCVGNNLRYGSKTQSLEGTWVLASEKDREVEFTKDKIRFNYYVYAYELEGNTIKFQEQHPTKNGWRGKMTYSFDGETLVLDLGDMSGYFYGKHGTVKLERPKSIVD